MKISDSLSIRANVSESSTWLAIICSWLSPYIWQVDLLIVIAVGALNWVIVQDAHEKAHEANAKQKGQ